MKERPNAILHMAAWGFGIGAVLSVVNIITEIGDPITWFICICATIITTYSGLCMGSILLHFTLKIPMPFMQSDIQPQREKIIPIIFFILFSVPMLITLIVIILSLGMYPNLYELARDLQGFFIAILLPALVVSIVYTFAAYRYLLRLYQWSNFIDVRKSKAKNDHLHSEQAT